jgi:hypothetical protein
MQAPPPAMPARQELINYRRAKVTEAGWLKVRRSDFGQALVHIAEGFDSGDPQETLTVLATYATAVLCASADGLFAIDPGDIARFISVNETALAAIIANAMHPHMETGCGCSIQ